MFCVFFVDKKLAVFLDYDGTLTPIVRNPDQAYMSEEMRQTVCFCLVFWSMLKLCLCVRFVLLLKLFQQRLSLAEGVTKSIGLFSWMSYTMQEVMDWI